MVITNHEKFAWKDCGRKDRMTRQMHNSAEKCLRRTMGSERCTLNRTLANAGKHGWHDVYQTGRRIPIMQSARQVAHQRLTRSTLIPNMNVPDL
jgi:hypothetical protein